jgi:NAD(P)-dependent dehydrogenase (short-subunit alcohol dehydrogenase family)
MADEQELQGKVAFVTGGASGIGRAGALRFAQAGARVAIADLQAEAAREVAAVIGDERALALTMDVTDEQQVEQAVRATVARFGGIDVGYFCAGVGGFAPIQRHPAEAFERVLRVNLFGVFYALKHVSARMIEQGGGGSLIAIASLNARQPAEGMAAYCASKAAVSMLMQVAALDLGRHGVRANAIAPGLIETPLSAGLWQNEAIRDAFIAETPLGRDGTPEEVAELALFLASDRSAFLTGQTLSLDGGQSLKKYPELFRLTGGRGERQI